MHLISDPLSGLPRASRGPALVVSALTVTGGSGALRVALCQRSACLEGIGGATPSSSRRFEEGLSPLVGVLSGIGRRGHE